MQCTRRTRTPHCGVTLLFHILETSKDMNIQSNIAIMLGDVTVLFSTIVDENSDELYWGLLDTDLVMKKNTLTVLMHLILNGMIKVKGQLSEMAKCLEDEEPRIVDLAKLFFTDLSTKDNAIYNNLPDGTCTPFFFFLFAASRLCLFRPSSHQPSLSRRTHDGQGRLPAHDVLHLHLYRKGNVPCAPLPHTHTYLRFSTGKTSREHHREAMPALPVTTLIKAHIFK